MSGLEELSDYGVSDAPAHAKSRLHRPRTRQGPRAMGGPERRPGDADVDLTFDTAGPGSPLAGEAKAVTRMST